MKTEPLIISHRGNGNHYPENTIEACEMALQQGATALEVDVRFCADGELVVFHDLWVKRLLGKNRALLTIPLSKLQQMNFKSLQAETKAKIPSLREFIEHFKNTVPINFDAKLIWPLVGPFAREIVRAIKDSGKTDQFWISSFNPVLLKTIKLNTKWIKTGYLFQYIPRFHQTIDSLCHNDAWHPHISLINQKFVKEALEHKKELYVWTVNEADDIKRLLDLKNINGIISDFSAKAHKTIQSYRKNG